MLHFLLWSRFLFLSLYYFLTRIVLGEGPQKQQAVDRGVGGKDDSISGLPSLAKLDATGRETDEKMKVQDPRREGSGPGREHHLVSPPDSRKRKRKVASEKVSSNLSVSFKSS